jgi:GT2 family glycosyltransferase
LLELTIVIPTLGDRPAPLARLLESIAAQTHPPVEILIAVPHEADFAGLPGTRTVRAERAIPAQRKAGAEAATTPIVLFVDDDMVLAPDFCAVILEVWERRGIANTAGVGGTITNESTGVWWHQALRRAAGLSHVATGEGATRVMASGHMRVVPQPRVESDVRFLSGAIMSLRRDLLELEPPDTQFLGYVYGDDLDILARLARHGTIVQTPLARAEHLPVNFGLGDGPDNAYRRARHYAYYRALHRPDGLVAHAAWHWANLTEGVIVASKSLRRRDASMLRAYRSGLRETKAALRDRQP